MVVSEAIYGWYPPAKSKWTKPTKPGQPVGYEAECLYKHYDSRFNADKRGVATPETPSVVCIDLNSPAPSKHGSAQGRAEGSSTRSHSRGSRASSRGSSVKVPRFHTPVNYGEAVQSPYVEQAARGQHQYGTRTSSGRPKKAWAMIPEATPILSPPAAEVRPQPPPSPKIYSPVPKHGQARPVQYQKTTSATSYSKAVTPTQSPKSVATSPAEFDILRTVEKKARVQSAPPQRPASKTKYQRPVKSAGPIRPDVTGALQVSTERRTAEGTPKPVRVQPTPTHECVRTTPTVAECTKVLDYDTELKKHGWKMEIPGDPLGLKAPCIAPRLAVTQKLPIPTVAPNPPKSHMEVFDTYFYNTIPRKPLSFTVHPEWVSEVLHAKRMAMQKKQGINFKHTNYSFAY